jgi:hypothetical protein
MEVVNNMQTAEALLHRFYRFYDGLVKSFIIEIDILKNDIILEIQVKDSLKSGNFVILRITFEKVTEYCIKYGLGGYIYVLSFGAVFSFQPDETFFVDFQDDEPRDVSTIRQSYFYLRAASAKWEIVEKL